MAAPIVMMHDFITTKSLSDRTIYSQRKQTTTTIIMDLMSLLMQDLCFIKRTARTNQVTPHAYGAALRQGLELRCKSECNIFKSDTYTSIYFYRITFMFV